MCPAPARETSRHRSVLLLLTHADLTAKLSLPSGLLEQAAFDVRKFVQERALGTGGCGGFYVEGGVGSGKSEDLERGQSVSPHTYS